MTAVGDAVSSADLLLGEDLVRLASRQPGTGGLELLDGWFATIQTEPERAP